MLIKHGMGRLAVIISTLAGLVSVAHAGDVKVINGSSCRQTPGDTNTPSRWSLSGLPGAPTAPYNSSISAIDIVCPLVRDADLAIGLNSLKVRGYLPTNTLKLTCTALMFNGVSGVVLQSSTKELFGPAGGGNVTLDFGPLFINQGNADAGYNVVCKVPSGGSVISIRYEEN